MLAALPRILFARPLGKGRFRNAVVTVAVATVVVAGASLIPRDTVPTPPPSPSGVDVWVATNGNDATCQRGQQQFPCLTFDRAYNIAQLGDEVEVAAGNYGAQLISDAPGKDSAGDLPDVVIAACTGCTVKV